MKYKITFIKETEKGTTKEVFDNVVELNMNSVRILFRYYKNNENTTLCIFSDEYDRFILEAYK